MNSLQSSSPQATPLTPTSEDGVRTFFEGLCAITETIERGAPARVAISITPSLHGLVKGFCGTDKRFSRVMSNIWLVEREQMMPQKENFSGFKFGLVLGAGLTAVVGILLKVFA